MELCFFWGIQYIPHHVLCYLWQTPLVKLHIVSDALIAISYYLIPVILLYFVREIKELPFKNIFILFGAFILSCGTTHIVDIWTLWHPNYWFYGVLKAITALISLYTALTLIPIIPQALKLQFPQSSARLDRQLNEEMADRNLVRQQLNQLTQELEQRVGKKNAALIKVDRALQDSIKFRDKIIDRTPNIFYIYDLVEQRNNIYCNLYINEFLGYTPQQIQKSKNALLDELIHPDDLQLFQQHLNNCLLLKDDKCLEIEYRIKNNTGEWYWLHDKNTIFSRDCNGKPQQILGIARDISHTKELDRQLKEQISVLTKTNQARVKLAEINEFLQVCDSLEEAQAVIANLLKPLFPETHGAIYLIENSKNLLDKIVEWGNSHSDSSFEPSECWAIRHGHPHQVYTNTPGLYCSHVNNTTADVSPTLCLPMIAKGETIGMLYLRFISSLTISKSIQNLAETVAQNIAMSVANLKLQEKLKHQSLQDPLTGLYDRRRC
jgi:PAS domain S-box-containing protein